MRKILYAFVIFAVFSVVSVHAGDRRVQKDQLTVATFNAEFLWDGIAPEEGRVVSRTPEEAQRHMGHIAKVVRALNADVLNLVEVENKQALALFNSEFLRGMGYAPYLKKGRDTYTGQDVAMLTRVDPKYALMRFDEKGRSGSVKKNVSKNYYSVFELGDMKVAIIGLHFLSGPDRKDRLHSRQAQAESMAMLARQLCQQGHEIIMLGDFNDFDGTVIDAAGSQPITRVLSICKLQTDSDPSNDLVNVAQFVSRSERYTSHYDRDRGGDVDGLRELSMIDHILVSKKLASMISGVSIVHQHDPTKVSDHFPVIVKFVL